MGLLMAVTAADIRAWLAALARVYPDNSRLLTDLDAAIGDADHGINMERGFTAVESELPAGAETIQAILQGAAAVLISRVGGASGPLYGTFFLRAASACAGRNELDAAALCAMFHAGVEGVRQRGKAAPGDKTMLDALAPAVEAMRRTLDAGLDLAAMLGAAADAAEAGMRGTIPMEARKGRASYLGARSIGHQDPGATSAWLLVKCAAECWRAARL
jgi:dihydroxyacetone kinase-like protein